MKIFHHISRSRAIALPLVLWGVAFLSALVIVAAVRVKERTEEQSHAERTFRARQLALKGLAIGRHPDVGESDPLLVSGDPETEGYEVRISDDSGRINPNFWIAQGDRELFRTLFASRDIPLRESDAAIDGLTDWIDGDDFRTLAGAEYPEYNAAGMPGLPANAPLSDLREMESVINLRDVLASFDGWRDLFSLYHSGKVNINEAGDDVLTDLAGLQPRQIEALNKFQDGQDGLPNTEDDQEFGEIEDAIDIAASDGPQTKALRSFFGVEGSVRRIESTGFCYGVSRKITVVTSGDSDTILAWEER
jgi:hypothetical protein